MPDAALPPQVQAALDLAPCGLLRTGPHGQIERVNLTFCRWLDYERDQLIGRKLEELMTVGGRIFHQTHLAPLMQIQGSVSEVKLEIVRRDGQALPMVLNAARHEAGGRMFSELALFIARDRDKYERELLLARRRLESLVDEGQARQEEAQHLAQIAEQMVGIVSHDLRSPLQTIQMGALLLARGEPTPHQLSVLGRITRAGERAQRLIADLLDFTQARLGEGLAVHPRAIDLHATVADVVDELAQAYPGRSVRHDYEGEGPCVVDPDRVAQLVGNLVANAMVYGDPAAPVSVRSTVAQDECRIAVHNAGAPIPPDIQAALFKPMVRGAVEHSATRSVGLGLFIVGEIAKAHGGRVVVHSTQAEGTTFAAAFPRGDGGGRPVQAA